MKKIVLLAGSVIFLLTVWAQVAAFAGPFEDGKAAYDRKDYQTVLKLWQPLAEQGDAAAQYNLGFMYYQGHGVSQDYAEAVKWYRKAADQGYAEAQTSLGYMYESGHGVSQDYAEALNWYRKAADQGEAGAQFNLGGMYFQGQGVSQNTAEAVQWYQKAAAQGNAQAETNLANIRQQQQQAVQQQASVRVEKSEIAACVTEVRNHSNAQFGMYIRSNFDAYVTTTGSVSDFGTDAERFEFQKCMSENGIEVSP